MAQWLLKIKRHNYENFVILFVNTGQENEERFNSLIAVIVNGILEFCE